MSSDTGGDIIIKGGSVELIYDPITYPLAVGIDPKTWKNVDKKIVQVVITGDNNEIMYDSGEDLEGLKFTIKTRCR